MKIQAMQEPISEQELLERQSAADPQNPRHHFMLGLSYLESGKWRRAVEAFQRVVGLAPQVDAAYFNLGNAYFELHQFSEAANAYSIAMRLCPEWETARNIAKALAADGQLEQAIQLLHQSIDRRELTAEQRAVNLRDLGFANVQSGNWIAALDFFEQSYAQGATDRSWECVLVASQAIESASEVLRRIASQTQLPPSTRTIIEEARALQRLNQHRQALEKLVENTQYASDLSTLFLALAEFHFQQGHLSEALGCVHNLNLKHPGNALWLSFWVDLLAYGSQVTPKRIFENSRRWYDSVQGQLIPGEPKQVQKDQENRKAPFELAILVNAHSQAEVELQILPWLRHRNRNQMRVTLLWDHWGDCFWTKELRSVVDDWRPIAMWTDVALAKWLGQNQISGFIDTAGHGLGTRLAVPSLYPEGTHLIWNYRFQTSGSDDVDYVIHDKSTAKLIDAQYVSERVISPRGPAWCYESHKPTSTKSCSAGSVCFGFSGELNLISPQSIDLWTMVLLAIPDARFVARTKHWACDQLRHEITESFAKREIDRNRLRFESSMGLDSAAERLEQIDVYLDAAPSNCLTGMLDALACGKPIVSLSGERPPELVSQALSEYCSNAVYCAKSSQEFVQLASDVALGISNPSNNVATRQKRFLDSPLCRPADYARSIDELLTSLLESTKST